MIKIFPLFACLSKVARRGHRQEHARSGTRKAELGKGSSLGEKIGKIREEQEGTTEDVKSGTIAISSQSSNSASAVISSKGTSSVTRKSSKNKLVTGEVKLPVIHSSVEQTLQQNSVIKPEKQQSHQQKQEQPCATGSDEREKVAKDKKSKSDSSRKSSSEKQEGVSKATDMYKKGGGNIPTDPLGSLPTSHTKKYLPRQQTWAGPHGSTPPPYTPSPTQSEYESCEQFEDY